LIHLSIVLNEYKVIFVSNPLGGYFWLHAFTQACNLMISNEFSLNPALKFTPKPPIEEFKKYDLFLHSVARREYIIFIIPLLK